MPDKITIHRRKNHRVGVFVDVQNLYHSAKNLYHSRVNFGELFKTAVADRELVRAVAYVVKSDTPEEKTFFDALEKSGFELKVKDLQIFAGGQKKADWDVGLAVDAIALSKQLDVVVIISGDGDFIPMVEYLQFSGLIVEAMSFGRSTSGKLKEVVNNFIDLDEHRKVLMRIPGVRPPSGRRGSKADKSETPSSSRSEEFTSTEDERPLTGFMPSRKNNKED